MASKRGRPKNTPEMYQRNGRWYADLRSYEDVGGGREALKRAGSGWATTDKEEAAELFQARLKELQDKRRGGVTGKSQRHTTLDRLVRDHLKLKEDAGRTSDSHMADLEQRLAEAVKYFGAKRDPRTIEPEDVRAWSKALAAGGDRKPGTVRHYLNALSGAYRRAAELLCVEPGMNPVANLTEKPTGSWSSADNTFFEVEDAALVLEAARVLEERDRVNATPGLHAIVAAFLLTGGRKSEVLGLDVEDVSFDRGEIRFRPNRHRGLKSKPSHRTVPLWPQLREILQAHMYAGDTPRTTGLLFPAPHGGRVKDMRKTWDEIAELCDLDAIRTRAFRTTYCTARLQTVQRILKPGRDPSTDPNAFDWIEVNRFNVAKEMGHGGLSMVDRIYGHMSRTPHRSEVVEYDARKLLRKWGQLADHARGAATEAEQAGDDTRAGELREEARRWQQKHDGYRERLRAIVGTAGVTDAQTAPEATGRV